MAQTPQHNPISFLARMCWNKNFLGKPTARKDVKCVLSLSRQMTHPRVRTPRRMPAGAGSLPAMISARRCLARSVTSITAFLARFGRGFFATSAGLSAAAGPRSTKAGEAGAAAVLLLNARQACSAGTRATDAAANFCRCMSGITGCAIAAQPSLIRDTMHAAAMVSLDSQPKHVKSTSIRNEGVLVPAAGWWVLRNSIWLKAYENKFRKFQSVVPKRSMTLLFFFWSFLSVISSGTCNAGADA